MSELELRAWTHDDLLSYRSNENIVSTYRKAQTPGSKLIDQSSIIGLQGPDPDDMRFMHSVLCQVGLPRAKIDGTEFHRKSGPAWLSVQAGMLDEGKGPIQQPIPYGALPRLIMASISTYSVRHKTREIPLGDSAADYLRQLGMERTGPRYKQLRTQVHAIAACRLQLGFNGRTYSGQPVEQFDAWNTDLGVSQKAAWPRWIILSEGYFSSLLRSAVPLDNRGLQILKGTALGLDLYVWLSRKLHALGVPVTLGWVGLKEQFGQEYIGAHGLKDFRREFLRVLRIVLMAYPQAKIDVVHGGIKLFYSPPPITYKG